MTNKTSTEDTEIESVLQDLAVSLPGTRPDLEPVLSGLDELLVPLLDTVPKLEPPKSLFAAIQAEIASEEEGSFRTIRADNSDWTALGQLIWTRLIAQDKDTGRRTSLVRCLAGAVIPSHYHEREELLFLLEGEITIGDVRFLPGDAQIAKAGSTHPEVRVPSGCLFLVTT